MHVYRFTYLTQESADLHKWGHKPCAPMKTMVGAPTGAKPRGARRAPKPNPLADLVWRQRSCRPGLRRAESALCRDEAGSGAKPQHSRSECCPPREKRGSTKSVDFVGKRRSSGMSEPRRSRRGEGYGACDDEAAGIAPRARLGLRLPCSLRITRF